jgi:hypothetical protein
MWRESGAGESSDEEEGPTWRASVVSTLTGKRQGFSSLDDLFDFLRGRENAILDRQPDDHQSEAGGQLLGVDRNLR